MNKKALIFGITGQDGSYLAELLLKKKYLVHGVKRRSSSINTFRIDHIYQDPHVKSRNFFLHYGDITDSTSVSKIIHADIPIVGSAKECLSALLLELNSRNLKLNESDISEWNKQISTWRDAHGLNHSLLELGPQNGKILPQQVVQSLYKETNQRMNDFLNKKN